MLLRHRFLLRTLLASALVTGLAACGSDSVDEVVVKATAEAGKGEGAAAIVRLKAGLQSHPDSGALRSLLGQLLLAGGDPVAAAVELDKALELKRSEDEVVPLLAEALVGSGRADKAVERFGATRLGSTAAQGMLKQSLASAYLGLGRLEEVKSALNAALQADPKLGPARLMSARLLAGRGETDQALALVNTVIADQPKFVDAKQLKAELLWVGKSDPYGAIKLLGEVLQVNPAYLPAHSTLLTILVQAGKVDAFKSALAGLKKVQPASPVALFFETQWLLAQGDIRKARESAQQLLRAAPEHALSLQLVGAVEVEDGALQLAESHLNKALQLSPGLAKARQLLGQIYLRAGQPDKALAAVQPLLAGEKPNAPAHSVAAEAYLQKGDIGRAEQQFAAAAKASPGDVKANTALAITEFYKGNADAGFAQLESAAAADKTSAYADLALIAARMRRNESAEALKAVQRLQAKLPTLAMPQLLQGQILLQRKDAAGARTSFDKALALDPSYFPAIEAMAALDLSEGKPQAAQQRFEAVAKQNPRNVRARLALAELKQRTGGKPDEVIDMLRQAVAADVGEPMSRLALVDYLLAQRRATAALTAAQESATAMPERAELLDALGRAQLAAGDTQQALNTFGKLASLQPRSTLPLLRIADSHLIKRDMPAAKSYLRKALELDPKLLPARRKLIQLALTDRKTDEALKLARDAQKAAPNEPIGFQLESQVHVAGKAWEAALAVSGAALRRSNGDPGIAMDHHALLIEAGRAAQANAFAESWLSNHERDTVFLHYLGSRALLQSDAALAEELYRRVLAVAPDDVMALNNLAWSLAKLHKPGGLDLILKAMKLMPDSPVLLDTLALVYGADGQWTKALEVQEAAIARAPDQASLRLSLCRLLIDSGDRKRARSELERLAQLGDGFAGQREVQALLRSL